MSKDRVIYCIYYALFKFQGLAWSVNHTVQYTLILIVKRSRLELKPRANPYYMWVIKAFTQLLVHILI